MEPQPEGKKLSVAGRIGHLILAVLCGWIPVLFIATLLWGTEAQMRGVYAFCGLIVISVFLAIMAFESLRLLASALTGRDY